VKSVLIAMAVSLVASYPSQLEAPVSGQATAPLSVIEVRQSGGLTIDTIARVKSAAALSGASVGDVDRVTLRLLALRRGEVVVQSPPEGFGYPLLASSIDSFSPLVAGEIGTALGEGKVVVGALSASLRGAQVGDVMTLETLAGAPLDLTIGSIVPDELIHWSEVMVSRPVGLQLGIDRPFALFLWGEDLVRTEEALVTSQLDPTVRVQGLHTEPMVDPVLPIAMVKQRFGEFAMQALAGDELLVDPAWEEANIVTVNVPPLGLFECHRLLVPYIRGVIDELAQSGLLDLIDPADFQLAGGCYNARLNRGSDPGYSLSRHSWGIAFDLNPSTNAFGAAPTMPAGVVEVFRRWGFSWGGTWAVPDGMHFEWRQLPSEYPRTCADLSLAPLYEGGLWYLRPASHSC
jgi:hypothetical protein